MWAPLPLHLTMRYLRTHTPELVSVGSARSLGRWASLDALKRQAKASQPLPAPGPAGGVAYRGGMYAR